MSKEAQSVPIVTLAGVANIGECKYLYIHLINIIDHVAAPALEEC